MNVSYYKKSVLEQNNSGKAYSFFNPSLVQIDQICGRRIRIFQKLPGLRPEPRWGAYSAPQTPSWIMAVLRTACLASQDKFSTFFPHPLHLGRTGFFPVATPLSTRRQHRSNNLATITRSWKTVMEARRPPCPTQLHVPLSGKAVGAVQLLNFTSRR